MDTTEAQEVPSEHEEELLPSEGGRVLDQVGLNPFPCILYNFIS